MAIILIILSIFTHQLEGIFIKKYNEKHYKGGFLFTSIVSFFSMMFFIMTDKNGFIFTKDVITYGLLGGSFYCLASFLTFVALGCGSFVMSKLMLSYGMLIPTIYGIYLGEQLSFIQCIGFIIIMISLCFVRGKSIENETTFSKKWIITILLSVLFTGLYGIINRKQQITFNNSFTNEYMIIALGFSALILFVVGLYNNIKDIGFIFKHSLVYSVGAGLSNGVTNFLILYVYTLVPISFAAPMNSGGAIIVSFILSKLLFREEFLKRQIFGVILGTIGIILLNIK